MNCMICQAVLTDSDYCPKCGSYIKAQKIAGKLSDLYYNQGLEKAQVRDLSGAMTCLKQSLKMNKLNIQARNLLGLVYYETGEIVAALSEWVISKHMMPEGNPAESYIEKLQKNPNKLDLINTSIKKYNQCLEYCRNGNLDMAKMQIKKVLANNPKLIKGYHLLALLYMQDEEYEKARKPLKSAARIDKTNTTTLRFLKEIEEQTGRATNLESRFRMKEKEGEPRDGSIVYKSGNDTIIQPPEYREKTITNTLVNLVLGLLVGAAALWFLIVPAKTQKINQEANQKIAEYSGKMASMSAELAKMEEEMTESTDSVNTAKTQIEEAGVKAESYEKLISAQQAFQQGKYDNAANAIVGVDAEQLSVEAKSVYDTIISAVGAQVKEKYKNQGMNAYSVENYEEAITYLKKALDIGNQDSETLIFLAQAYEKQGDTGVANKWYQKIVEDFPGTQYAALAKNYMQANGGVITDEEEDPEGKDVEDSQPSDDQDKPKEDSKVQTGELVE